MMKELLISFLNRMFKFCLLPSDARFISLLNEYTGYAYNINVLISNSETKVFRFTSNDTNIPDVDIKFNMSPAGAVMSIDASEIKLKKAA